VKKTDLPEIQQVTDNRTGNGEAMFQIEALDHIGLIVQNVQYSVEWYSSVLGMHPCQACSLSGEKQQSIRVTSGSASIVLFPPSARNKVMPFYGHIAMRLLRTDFERAKEHLQSKRVPFNIVSYPSYDSIYLKDPDGYQIELSTAK
jgi:catechol-2,3-dioxygenase